MFVDLGSDKLNWPDCVSFVTLPLSYMIIRIMVQSWPLLLERLQIRRHLKGDSVKKNKNRRKSNRIPDDDGGGGGGGDYKQTALPFSTITVIMFSVLAGNPTEIAYVGTVFVFLLLSYVPCALLIAHLYMPMFYKHSLKSPNEYLELRFNKFVRILAATLMIFQMVAISSITLGFPAVALSKMTGYPLWICVLLTGLLALTYYGISMKETRLWAELLQSLAAVSLLVGMIVVGANYSGSVDTAITVMAEKLFTEMRSSPLDSFNVYSLLSVIVGGSFTLLGLLSFNPVLMQEFVKITELRNAKIAVYLNSFVGAIFFAITAVCGFIWHTAISDEEVMNTSDYNRLLAAFTIATTRSLVLVRGLFLGLLFMASLSSSVTLANGAATVFSRDLCEKFGTYHHRPRGRLVVLTELGMIALAAAASYGFIQTHQSLLQLALLFSGAFGGPLLAVFTAGILFSCVNKHGALIGLVVSQIFGVSFICFNFLYEKSRADCSQFDQCQIVSVTGSMSEVLEIVRPFFGISLLYVAPICCAIGLIIALLISVATSFCVKRPLAANRYIACSPQDLLSCICPPKCGPEPLMRRDESLNESCSTCPRRTLS